MCIYYIDWQVLFGEVKCSHPGNYTVFFENTIFRLPNEVGTPRIHDFFFVYIIYIIFKNIFIYI